MYFEQMRCTGLHPDYFLDESYDPSRDAPFSIIDRVTLRDSTGKPLVHTPQEPWLKTTPGTIFEMTGNFKPRARKQPWWRRLRARLSYWIMMTVRPEWFAVQMHEDDNEQL